MGKLFLNKKYLKNLFLTALLLNIFFSLANAQDFSPNFSFKGYNKTLIYSSQSITSKQDYLLLINRQRQDMQYSINSDWDLKMIFDNEFYTGSFFHTPEGAMAFSVTDPQAFSSQSYLFKDSEKADQLKLYRFYTRYHVDTWNIHLGLHRVSWGVGNFWTPVDLFAPVNPQSIESLEKVGAYGITVQNQLDSFSTLEAVMLWNNQKSVDRSALRFHSNFDQWDYSLMTYSVQNDLAYGFDLAGAVWGGAGFRTELINRTGVSGYTSYVLSLDYKFNEAWYGLVEYFYNGQGKNHPYQKGDRYLGSLLSYQLSALTIANFSNIYNLNDASYFSNLGLSHNLAENMDLSGGIIFFNGNAGSEYGALPNTYYTSFQYSF
jgi:hypothetical protein